MGQWRSWGSTYIFQVLYRYICVEPHIIRCPFLKLDTNFGQVLNLGHSCPQVCIMPTWGTQLQNWWHFTQNSASSLICVQMSLEPQISMCPILAHVPILGVQLQNLAKVPQTPNQHFIFFKLEPILGSSLFLFWHWCNVWDYHLCYFGTCADSGIIACPHVGTHNNFLKTYQEALMTTNV